MGIRCDPFGMARAHRTTTAFFRHHTAIRLVLAIGLIVAGLVSWANSEPATVTQPIVVAARDIASGASLTAADLTTGYDSLGLADVDPAALLGETVRGPISEGEPITMSRITPGRSLTVESGRVVFPLPLPDDGMAGMLVAGDVVDVVVASDRLSDLSDNENPVRTAASRVEVLTVVAPNSKDTLAPGSSDSAVLLDVTNAQAKELASIRRSDRVSLTLAGR